MSELKSLKGSVAGNDMDPDGDKLTFALVQTPVHGQVVMKPDGSYVYQPAPGFHGKDVFVYQVKDADGGISTAHVVIDVVEESKQNISQGGDPKPQEPTIHGVPVSLLEKILANTDHDHGTIEITYPNNVFIQFVVEGNTIKLESQFGLGTHGESARYMISFSANQSGDGSLMKGADGQLLFSDGLTSVDFNDSTTSVTPKAHKADAGHLAATEHVAILLPESSSEFGIVIPFPAGIPQGVSFSDQLAAFRDRFDLQAEALLARFAAVA